MNSKDIFFKIIHGFLLNIFHPPKLSMHNEYDILVALTDYPSSYFSQN